MKEADVSSLEHTSWRCQYRFNSGRCDVSGCSNKAVALSFKTDCTAKFPDIESLIVSTADSIVFPLHWHRICRRSHDGLLEAPSQKLVRYNQRKALWRTCRAHTHQRACLFVTVCVNHLRPYITLSFTSCDSDSKNLFKTFEKS